jgi:hypothetical protein
MSNLSIDYIYKNMRKTITVVFSYCSQLVSLSKF